MVLKRNLLGWKVEEYWFDEAGYLASQADIAALRTHADVGHYHCRIPEKTLLVAMNRPEEEILRGFQSRARASIRQGERTITVEPAETADARANFYRAYAAFAVERGLLIPRPEEEAELEILLARDASGDLIQAAAFLPAPAVGVYRYRYGVSLKKSQANSYLLFAAMRRAKARGMAHFDLGGIDPWAKPGSREAGINFFKSQFGGRETPSHLFLRAARPPTRVLLGLLQGVISWGPSYSLLMGWAGKFSK